MITEWVVGGCDPEAARFVDLFLSSVPAELFAALDIDPADERSLVSLLYLAF